MPIVLLVEDDADVRALIESTLLEKGLEVRATDSDRGACRVLEREGAAVAVVVADIHLGSGGSGFDVAKRARKANPRVEVVYITGQGLKADTLGVEGGVLFPKPFNLNDLGDMILALGGGARARD